MCELGGVSRASFYRHWEAEGPSEAEMAVRDAVQRVALGNRFYGYRRVQAQLRQEGYAVSGNRVRQLLREDNLLALRRRRFVVTTDSQHQLRVHPNLAQRLELTQTNQLWVADLTYVRLRREFVYVAVVLDAYSRRAVGWAAGRRMDASLPLMALRRAVTQRQPQPGLVLHSDRGSVYASADYQEYLESLQAVASMSRAGRPWENGKCESFIKTLKQEEIEARQYASLEEVEQHVDEFLEQIYNRQRLHSALGYSSPAQFEAAQAARQTDPPTVWQPAVLRLPAYQERTAGEVQP